MKVVMCKWAGGIKATLPDWFVHDESVELTMDMLQELYNSGVNVMLTRTQTGEPLLFVDDKRFTQR